MNRCIVLLLVGSLVTACGESSEEEADIVVEAEPGALAVPADVTVDMAPSHGGTVVAAGPHPVEVVTRDDGKVDAYFVGDAPPPPGVELTVRVPTSEGVRPTVLTWDPAVERYRGTVREAQVVPGPLEVVVVVQGERYRGNAPTLVIIEAPASAADVVVESPRPRRRTVVERPGPPSTVVVERPARPRVDVRIQAPGRPPPPRVVVERPGPPNVIVHRPGRRRGRVRGRGGDDDDRGRGRVRDRRGDDDDDRRGRRRRHRDDDD